MKHRKLLSGLTALFMTASVIPYQGTASHSVSNNNTLSAEAAGNNTVFGERDLNDLQNYLLGKTNGEALIEKQYDLNNDGVWDVFDLCLMRKKVISDQQSGTSGLCINEICSTNKKSIKAADGSSPDWIELYNAGDNVCDLSGVGVSDGDKNRFKFTFPQGTTLGAGKYIIIFCDDTDVTTGELHAAFKISAAGETIYLTSPDGTEIDKLELPELDTDVTYGRTPDGSDSMALLKPTPAASNSSAEVVYRVEKPAFSTEGGFYDSAFNLEIAGSSGCTVLYTLDGSDPRTSGSAKQYQGSINIRNNTNDTNQLAAIRDISLRGYNPPNYNVDKGMIVRAVCRDSGGIYSEVATNSYFIGKTASYYKDMKVLSISTDSSNFFDKEKGIYMIGDQYYRWKNSGSFDPNLDVGSSENPTNYNSEGKEWERPCNIQVFEQGKLKFTEDVDSVGMNCLTALLSSISILTCSR